jgi:hypothetical protein
MARNLEPPKIECKINRGMCKALHARSCVRSIAGQKAAGDSERARRVSFTAFAAVYWPAPRRRICFRASIEE